ncbi:lytic murein transglycosylase B [Thermomonas sp.]|jgi:membrane-bound lytic murein transglycosylase B|uniref:lytic murein transglycosylase B n=1 Tax=Thermomonas sp. TaxID=1971895 RepID=UPI001B4A4635|nr:lytic murein transglycosylase B [Thermomonas sp.]MBK6416023.1 lytic murein transglycosylase B [Thermomonas sp.]MBK7205063.1 lytic murein transglycosylase B [Thermomonas sp.]MBL0228266.1 lytic murein transglycosylase B [Thermomonas sp.]MBP7158429.1 lytic murein transglycosylase B [Thermomonas sp.]MBP7789333.1 lytic murein transglycosylase B [Thermomonas sp.]
MIRRALLPSLAALALAACAVPPPKPMPQPSAPPVPPPPVAPTPPPVVFGDVSAARAEFVRSTSQRFGIPAAEIEAVLAKAQLREGIVKAMARPAEAKPWRDYRPIFIQPRRIDGGRAFLAEHRAALQRAEDKYGVPKEVVTAILGVETSYGGNKGSHLVVDALYTLAFAYPRSGDPAKVDRENKREAFFRDELAQLFALGKEQGFDIATLKGSYAGAMGWGQFMPSSYRDYAVDGDGDGRVDLFDNLDDVFASVANYFAKKGKWQANGPVMERARRDAGAADFANPGNAVTLDQGLAGLAAKGYRPAAMRFIHTENGPPVTLVTLEGAAGPEYWIVYNNFKAITTYNISRLYATAVYQLAEAIAGRDPDPQ